MLSNEKIIDKAIKFLKKIKKDKGILNITIDGPSLREIGGDAKNIYGIVEADIHIEWKGLKKQARDF